MSLSDISLERLFNDLQKLYGTERALKVVTLNSSVPENYDYRGLTWTGGNLTSIVFKTGGIGGTTVATLTLGYDINNNLTSITRS